MDHRLAGQYWERNAIAWTLLARQGWDVYRDAVNTPAFMQLLPEISGLTGLDIGCGEGHNTRLLAGRGARMTAVDVAPTFIHYSQEAERAYALGIGYAVASALELPFRSEQFDFITAFMSLMDMPDTDITLREIQRLLRPGGFLQFSIVHPCFPSSKGRSYFDRIDGDKIDRWLFSTAPAHVKVGMRPFEIPIFHRTLSDWINSVIDAGLVVEKTGEPHASEDTASMIPAVADTRRAPYFLHIRCRKALI